MERRITIEPKGEQRPGTPLRYKAEVRRGIYLGFDSFGFGLDICSKTLLLTLTPRRGSKNGSGEAQAKESHFLRIYEYEGVGLRPSDYLYRDVIGERVIEIAGDGDLTSHVELEVNGIYNDTLLKRLLLRK